MNAHTEDALYCPICGYNLTGLPENRCPECGKPFSPKELRWWAQSGFDDVPGRALVYYLFSAPLACWLVTCICFLWDLPELVFGSGTILIALWAVANSVHWALRVTEPERRRVGKLRLLPFLSLALKALILQFVLGGWPFMVLR